MTTPFPSRDHLSIAASYEANNMNSASATTTNLQARGKGKHVCSYGTNCDRGGVNEDGTVVVFERNSAFR